MIAILQSKIVICFHHKPNHFDQVKKQRIIEELASTLLRSWAKRIMKAGLQSPGASISALQMFFRVA
jgi:hypothetical protein